MLEELLASLNKTTALIIAQLSESGQPIRHRFFLADSTARGSCDCPEPAERLAKPSQRRP